MAQSTKPTSHLGVFWEISVQSIRHLCVVTLAAVRLAGIAAAIGLVATVPALAAEKSADLGKYCRNVHGPTAFANVDRRDNGLLCSIRTSGGLGLTHNKIKAADVCAKQHGTSRFRRQGQELICLKGPGDAGNQAGRSIDLEQHCKKAHGPDAFLTKRRTDNKPMCTIRTDGGLGLRHHLIDLASLCGGGMSDSRIDGAIVTCMRSSETDPEDQPRVGAGSKAGPKPGQVPPGPIPPGPKPKNNGTGQPDLANIDPDQMMAHACQALGGRWRAGTIPIIEGYFEEMNRQIEARLAGCGPIDPFCKPRAWVEQGMETYFRTYLIWQCHVALISEPDTHRPEDIRLARYEACEISKKLISLPDMIDANGGELSMVSRDFFIKQFEIDSVCKEPNLKGQSAIKSKAEAEEEVRVACKNVEHQEKFGFSAEPINLGGNWKAATAMAVRPLYGKYQKIMREAKDGQDYTFGQVNGFYKLTAYTTILEVLKCDIAVIRNDQHYTADDLNQTKNEACQLREILASIFPESMARVKAEYRIILDEIRFCDKPKPVLRLVRITSNGIEEVDENIEFYGGPYYLEAIYKSPQNSPVKSIKWENIGRSTESGSLSSVNVFVYPLESDPKIFHSKEFYIFPESLTPDPLQVEGVTP